MEEQRKLNGDAKVLSLQISNLEKIRKEDHASNEKKYDILFKNSELIKKSISDLPCKVHVERMFWIKLFLVGVYGITSGIVYWIAQIHLVRPQ